MILRDFPDFPYYSYIESSVCFYQKRIILIKVIKKVKATHDLIYSQNVRKKYTLLRRVIF